MLEEALWMNRRWEGVMGNGDDFDEFSDNSTTPNFCNTEGICWISELRACEAKSNRRSMGGQDLEVFFVQSGHPCDRTNSVKTRVRCKQNASERVPSLFVS